MDREAAAHLLAHIAKARRYNRIVDHITLEIPSRRSHLTAYKTSGKAIHRKASDIGRETPWVLRPFPNSGIALWFSLLVRTDTLLSQDLAVQRRVYMPTTAESERRINESRDLSS